MRKQIIYGLMLTLVAFWCGNITGHFGWCFFFATWVWIAIQVRGYLRLRSWSRQPLGRPENGPPHWFDLAYTPYRALVRQRTRTKNMASRVRQIISLTEVIPDGVIILDEIHEIEGFNAAAKHLLSLSDADLGISIGSIVRVPEFVMFLRTQDTEPLEFSLPGHADTTLEARKVDVDEGRSILLIRDITTLNRLLTMRQNFVANVSHELRTPLTVVNGYLESLEDPELDDDLKLQLLPRLAAPMRRMQSLVEDLLLLTQLESSPEETHKAAVNMAAVIERAGAELDTLTTAPNQLRLNLTSNAKVAGFETELHSVCVNLISNAIKYSPDGNPIEVSWTDTPEGALFQVKDSGAGIAPEHLDRLTERFYRVDMSGARARGGTGLGLAIVKHVLRRHGSELNIESELGVGSIFSCVFQPVDLNLQPSPSTSLSSSQSPKTVESETVGQTDSSLDEHSNPDEVEAADDAIAPTISRTVSGAASDSAAH